MAQYIMKRLSEDMHGEGERLYPKLVKGQTTDLDTLAAMIEHATSFTRGDVEGVLSAFVDVVQQKIAAGDTVQIRGLGTLYPVLGLVDKEERGAWHDAAGRVTTGRNVQLKTVNFRPSRCLLASTRQRMELTKLDDSVVTQAQGVSTTLEERTAAAVAYLKSNGYMRVADYAHLTHLSRTTAARELRQLAADETSGITSRGTHAGKLYVLRKEDDIATAATGE